MTDGKLRTIAIEVAADMLLDSRVAHETKAGIIKHVLCNPDIYHAARLEAQAPAKETA